MKIKQLAMHSLLAGALFLPLSAGAGQKDMSAQYQEAAQDYFEMRLQSGYRAHFRSVGHPYRADMVLRGKDGQDHEWTGWAVDMKVSTHLSGARSSRHQAYTIVFMEGQPVAMKRDLVRFSPRRDQLPGDGV